MRKKIIGYVVLGWRFGPVPLVYVAEKAETHEDGPTYALFNPIYDAATLFPTRQAAKKAVSDTDKFQKQGQFRSKEYMTEHKIVPVVEL